jgi:hypothetical protein
MLELREILLVKENKDNLLFIGILRDMRMVITSHHFTS